MFRWIFLIWVLGLYSTNGFANANLLVLTDQTSKIQLGSYAHILEDVDSRLSINSILENKDPQINFSPSTSTVPNFGYSPSVFWFKVNLVNQSTRHQIWLLEQHFANTSYIDMYLVQAGRVIAQKQSGLLRPLFTRDRNHQRIIFELHLEPDIPYDLYLRVKNLDVMKLDFLLWQTAAFEEMDHVHSYWFGLFYGAIGIILGYNLFLLFSLREKNYFWFLCFSGSYALTMLFYDGIGYGNIPDSWLPFGHNMQQFFLSLSTIGALKFANEFLPAVSQHGWIKKGHQLLLFVAVMIAMLVPFTDNYVLLAFQDLTVLCSIIFILIHSFFAIKIDARTGRVFLFTWALFLFTSIFPFIINLGWIDAAEWGDIVFRIGFVWLVLAMSLGLADSINRLKQESYQNALALLESEEQKRLAMQAAKMGTWLWDPNTGQLDWSDETFRIFGIDDTKTPLLIENFIEMVYPQDRDLVSAKIENSMKNHIPYFVEYRIVQKNGQILWVAATGQVQYDKENKPRKMLGTLQDITTIKEMELAQKSADLRFQAMVEQAPLSIQVFSPNGDLLKANKAWCQLWNRTQQDIGNYNIFNDPRIRASGMLPDIKLGFQGEVAILTPRKITISTESSVKERWIEGYIYPIGLHANEVDEVIVVNEDVTDKAGFEESIKSIAAGVSSFTGQNFFEQLVIHLAKLFDADYAFVGLLDKQNANQVNTLVVCARGKIADNISYGLAGTPCANVIGQDICAYEDKVQELFPKDKLLVDMGVNSYIGTPLFDSQNNSIGLIVVLSSKPIYGRKSEKDIIKIFASRASAELERLEAEQVIEQHKNHLEELVEVRTKELQRVNEELASFSYSVSHDLRAPVRALNGISQALLEDYNSQLDDVGKDYLERIRHNSVRMSDLINDLLDLSRLGKKEMRSGKIYPGEIAEEIMQDLIKQNPERNVVWTNQVDVEDYGDENLIRIVLQNLVGNAWKYSSKKSQADIRFSILQTDGKRIYQISDNGAGFDMQFSDKLFGAFQRLHKYLEFEGNGIGLATVKRIINRHGGDIWAHSEVGKGASFYFTLNVDPHLK